jgi:protein-S-isoprenylcysteine O-methyltransferase Ste14
MKKAAIALGLALWTAVFIGGSLFLAAGRTDVPLLWVNVLVWAGSTFVIGWIMDLDLMRERSRIGGGIRGRLLQVFGLPVLASHYVVAGLDVGRFHWSDRVPVGLHAVGLGLMLLAFGLLSWTIYVNPFFAKAVRIQDDRGHEIVTSGPYGHVRHPGYAAFALIFLASGLALGSYLSLIPATGFALFFIWRTAVEDRFLQENLEGYASYAQRVHHRLIPGLW